MPTRKNTVYKIRARREGALERALKRQSTLQTKPDKTDRESVRLKSLEREIEILELRIRENR